jgi:hypothetical protein
VIGNFNIPYSAQYTTTNLEGHEHPVPLVGAPTLVWHLGISPHWPSKRPSEDAALNEVHNALAQTYEETRTIFFSEINRLLQALQRAAAFPHDSAKTFNAEHVPEPWDTWRSLGDPFYVARPGSIRFTLWWPDASDRPDPEPTPDALRVKVHAGAHRDYVTLSFYLDATKLWNAPTAVRHAPAPGVRRNRILTEVERVRTICEARLSADETGVRPVDPELLPEDGLSAADATALMAASRFLYAELWDEFCNAVIGSARLSVLGNCRVFANFRGLVLSTNGLPEAKEERRFAGSSGAETFPRFQGNGGIDHTGVRSSSEPNEANAVVKAFWPFVRRVTRDADRKEFVACGVMNWRALYVTSLNCPPSFEWAEEARGVETEVPVGHLPDASSYPSGSKGEEPIHYLLISKGEPHRRQIGRVIERINAMGTMRLIALRDYNIIRDASTHIQLRGQELDTMMRKWSIGRAKIRDKYDQRKGRLRDEALSDVQDQEDKEIQVLADTVEKDLIELSAALDEVGTKAVHGIHFRINRSRYYATEFESLLASLRIGNIDTWVSYEQFVTRGLKPTFDFIDSVGTRLLGLRTRLQSVLEGIETSALVKQIAATRENTAQLKTIARAFTRLYRLIRLASIIVAALSLVVALLRWQGDFGKIIEWIMRQ